MMLTHNALHLLLHTQNKSCSFADAPTQSSGHHIDKTLHTTKGEKKEINQKNCVAE